jgi:hypothetical protein
MTSEEAKDAVGEAPASEETAELAAAKKEMIAIKRGIGGLTEVYDNDRQTVETALAACTDALTRWFGRYHDLAAKHERAKHLVIDFGVEAPALPKLEAPGLAATQMVMDLLRVVQTFRAHKMQPSPKQQAAEAAKRAAEDERRAQQAAKASADLERSGYGAAARQIKELSKTGRVQSV